VIVSPHRDLEPIFKAYDVRGIVPQELDEDVARSIGASFADWSGVPSVAVGYDCRLSSPWLSAALREGIASRGADVIDIGLASTDLPVPVTLSCRRGRSGLAPGVRARYLGRVLRGDQRGDPAATAEYISFRPRESSGVRTSASETSAVVLEITSM